MVQSEGAPSIIWTNHSEVLALLGPIRVKCRHYLDQSELNAGIIWTNHSEVLALLGPIRVKCWHYVDQ